MFIPSVLHPCTALFMRCQQVSGTHYTGEDELALAALAPQVHATLVFHPGFCGSMFLFL